MFKAVPNNVKFPALEEEIPGFDQGAKGGNGLFHRDVQGPVQDDPEGAIGVVFPQENHRVAEVRIEQATA